MSRSSEQTRVRILDAAIAEFRHRGYAGANLRRIASAAHATTGAIYNLIDTKFLTGILLLLLSMLLFAMVAFLMSVRTTLDATGIHIGTATGARDFPWPESRTGMFVQIKIAGGKVNHPPPQRLSRLGDAGAKAVMLQRRHPRQTDANDLDNLIDAIVEANHEQHYAPPRKVWPEALGDNLPLNGFDKPLYGIDEPTPADSDTPIVGTVQGSTVFFGLADIPEDQVQYNHCQ